MMSNNSRFREVWAITVALATLSFTSACATSKRSEPPGSAASVNATPAQAQPSYAAPPAELEREKADESAPEAVSPPAPVLAPSRSRDTPAQAAKPSGGANPAAAPARAASGELRGPTAKKSKGEAKALDEAEQSNDMLAGRDDGADPLLPSVKDTSDLRVALQDWQNAANQLSTSRGCEDGCRAFQSMQRAAGRICNLVLNQDPAQRCATAKSRVEAAGRDISQRCGKCDR